jgi:hypothetical protein
MQLGNASECSNRVQVAQDSKVVVVALYIFAMLLWAEMYLNRGVSKITDATISPPKTATEKQPQSDSSLS